MTQVFKEQYNNHKDIPMNISFRSKYLPEMVNISLIHSALLMMFYYFGYEYILVKAAGVARNLIVGKKSAWASHQLIAVNTEPWPDPLPLVAAIKHPHKIRAFIIALPVPWNPNVSRAVFLPGFGEDGMDAFSRLMDMRKEKRKIPDVRVDMDIFEPDPQYQLTFGNCTRFWEHKRPARFK